jgi:hypothetical protein
MLDTLYIQFSWECSSSEKTRENDSKKNSRTFFELIAHCG